MIPYRQIQNAERFDSPVSDEMAAALDLWGKMYIGKAPWLKDSGMKSLNLAPLICAELSRQVTMEMKWSITGSKRAEYLSEQLVHCTGAVLREKTEQGMAAGGMVIKPCPKDDSIFFDFVPDWCIYPVSFDGSGRMTDVIFRDSYRDGDIYYTRLERHAVSGEDVIITQRCFRSRDPDVPGAECPLSSVPLWSALEPELTVTGTGGRPLFGWYRVAASNTVDVDSVLGASVYARAVGCIRDADEQYSRLMWEYEAKETAIDVDPTALLPKDIKGADGSRYVMPKLNERLFRAVDLGTDETYRVFDPPIRDVSLMNGLNAVLCRIEDLCGLARGTLSDPSAQAMTATQILILKQRTYETIKANQQALEQCLRDVIHAADVYADALGLAPPGDMEISFEWDDSVAVDTGQELDQRLRLVSAGAMSKAELRSWYLGETPEQADEAVRKISRERLTDMAAAFGGSGADT